MTTPNDTQALAAIAERHAKITKLEDEIPLTTFEGNRDDCQAVWRLPAHAARVLCELRNAVPELLADISTLLKAVADRDATIARREANLVAEMRRVDELQAEVARLTAERDEAAAEAARRERERIVAWLRKETETESIVETARAAWAYANAIERCEHADAIAAGEGPTA